MKNIELLKLDDATRDAVLRIDAQHQRGAKIRTDILEVEGDIVTIRVEQFRKYTDKVFTAMELIDKAKEVLSPVEGFTFRFRPLVFKGEGIEAVSASWVRNQMKKHGLNNTDICNDFQIDKHVISKLMNGTYGFTNWHQAAFYYYFKYKESNRS